MKVWRKLPLRPFVTYYALKAIWSEDFDRANRVVREVAKSPETRQFKWWADIDRMAVSNPRHGENTFRNLAARVRMGSYGPEAATLLELAYLGLKKRGR